MPLISLMRLRTLPIAITVIFCGTAVAYLEGHFDWRIFLLTLLTALSLQVVCNIADDFGDGVRGADSHRPEKKLTAGKVSLGEIKNYIYVFVVISIALGIALLALSVDSLQEWLLFMGLGALSLLAAVFYTIGRYAYGYFGLGDVAVFIFFGLVGVGGSYLLQSDAWHMSVLFPAVGAGLLSTAVLNVNNMRDITTDKAVGKNTLAVILGLERSKFFQLFLIIAGLLAYVLFAFLYCPLSLLCLIALPLIFRHIKNVFKAHREAEIGKELKPMVLVNSVVNLLFVIGIVFAR